MNLRLIWQFMEHLVTPKYYMLGGTVGLLYTTQLTTITLLQHDRAHMEQDISFQYTWCHSKFLLGCVFFLCLMAMLHQLQFLTSSLGTVASNLNWTPLLHTGIEIWSGFSTACYAVGNESIHFKQTMCWTNLIHNSLTGRDFEMVSRIWGNIILFMPKSQMRKCFFLMNGH